jgi:hypothetical protein
MRHSHLVCGIVFLIYEFVFTCSSMSQACPVSELLDPTGEFQIGTSTPPIRSASFQGKPLLNQVQLWYPSSEKGQPTKAA